MTKAPQVVADTQRFKVFVDKKPTAPLTAKEFDVLVYLAKYNGIVRSREDVLNAVWGHEADLTTRTVDQHVARLRRKLGKHQTLTKNRAHGLRGIVTTVATRGYAVEGVKVI